MQSSQVWSATKELKISLNKQEVGHMYHTKWTTSMKELFKRRCCVWGYHMYKEVWGVAVGEVLMCEQKPNKTSDRYAVAVEKELLLDTCLESLREFAVPLTG